MLDVCDMTRVVVRPAATHHREGSRKRCQGGPENESRSSLFLDRALVSSLLAVAWDKDSPLECSRAIHGTRRAELP